MNAGRDVERLIAGWFVEEAAVHSPDRVLTEARRVVSSTSQRRFAADWRQPVYISPIRLTLMAAALVVALVGGGIIGRATAPSGPASPLGTPAPTSPAPSADADAKLVAYRAARRDICVNYNRLLEPLKARLVGLTEPETPPADRAIAIQALTDLVGLSEAMVVELDRLEPPPAMAADELVNLTNFRQVNRLIREILAALAAGDYAGATALDLATNPLSEDIATYEQTYVLSPCP